jgi:hypothetical protein
MNTPEDSNKLRENSHRRNFDAAFVPARGMICEELMIVLLLAQNRLGLRSGA